MIIVLSNRVNDISQEIYDSVIESMDRNTIQCDQCSQCGFHINGYDYKTIRASKKILKILLSLPTFWFTIIFSFIVILFLCLCLEW